MTRTCRRHALAALAAIHLVVMGAVAAAAPALAMQVLDAVDHAELAAEISSTGVNRIALAGDRIVRVVRAPDGYAVEHDAASGDLYLRSAGTDPGDGDRDAEASLFIGTERGFTYRLTLVPTEREPAQILIRNADASRPDAAVAATPAAGGARVAALVRLVRAVARREPLPGYAVEAGGGRSLPGLTLSGLRFIETWRGPHLAALVFEADRSAPGGGNGAAGLAGTMTGTPGIGGAADGARLAALWLAAPGTGPAGGRLAVAVVEPAAAGAAR